MKNVFDFDAEKVNGDVISLKQYEGKVLIIVNSATRCGFTPQYDELQSLYERYVDKGFEVLEFPCNQFGKQAPESDEEIVSFCDAKFGLTFPHFAKIDVNGENAAPLYKFLQEQKGFAGFDKEHPLTPMLESMLERADLDYASKADIKWNFTKFIVDRNGNVVARFEPTADMINVEECINELL